MRIANPIYDVVFKYLMEDTKIAKNLLSKIIGEEITKEEFIEQLTHNSHIIQILRIGKKERAQVSTLFNTVGRKPFDNKLT